MRELRELLHSPTTSSRITLFSSTSRITFSHQLRELLFSSTARITLFSSTSRITFLIESVCYDLWCEECGIKVCAYKGETGRNCYSRGCEHLENLEARDEDKSVLWLHSVHHHNSRVDVHYSMRTTGSYSDPMDRQLQERVNITNFKGPILMNRRNEMGGVRVERMRYRRWGGD